MRIKNLFSFLFLMELIIFLVFGLVEESYIKIIVYFYSIV